MKTFFHLLQDGEIPIYSNLKSPSVRIWYAVSDRGRKGWVRQTRPQMAEAKKRSMLVPHQSSVSLLNSLVPLTTIKTPRFPAWLKAKIKSLETTKGSVHVIVRWADDIDVACGIWHDSRRYPLKLYGDCDTFEAVKIACAKAAAAYAKSFGVKKAHG